MAANGSKAESSAQGTVTVAVKAPNGIVLRAFRWEEVQEPVMGGGYRSVKTAVEVGERFYLKGYAAPFGQVPAVPVVCGYAINHGVPADLWHAWLEQNKHSDLVKRGIISAYAKSDDAEAFAREHHDVRSGLEPMAREEYDESGNVIPSTVDQRIPRKRDPRTGRLVPNVVADNRQAA